MLPWVLLVIAGLLEVVWASMLKHAGTSARFWPWMLTIGAMIASFALLTHAMKALPLGVAYTVWVGIGAVGTVIVGVALLGERLSAVQTVSLALIVLGIVGLKLSTPTGANPGSPAAPASASPAAPADAGAPRNP